MRLVHISNTLVIWVLLHKWSLKTTTFYKWLSSGLMQEKTCLSNIPADFTDGSQDCHKAQKEESCLFLYRDASTKHNLDLGLKAVYLPMTFLNLTSA